MCGIVGLFLKDKALEPQLGALLTDMLITMTDRGPDSAGIAIYGNTAEGRTKLTVQSDEGDAVFGDLAEKLGAVIMFFVLGFLPGFAVAKLQAAAGVLRIPEEVELQGLDYAEHHAYEDAKTDIIEADKAYLASRTTPAE
ncbi:MAG: hypothetical protein RLN70_13455 [Rhodospirillaceae bacterium]